MLTVRLDSAVPLADQLVAGLRGAIARGEVEPGGRLPTVRQLAADLGIHMNTVARAYRALESQGLVSTVRGRGTVVTAATERKGRAAEPEEVAERVASALADARLAGLDREATEDLLARALDALWPRPPRAASAHASPSDED
jgi:GntR family transcriptional regulator